MSHFFYRVGATFLALALSGCASPFTPEAMERLRIGMPANEVREMFGAPKEVRTAVCGTATAGGGWVCETWKYQDPITDKVSDFTFSVNRDLKLLNSWNVKR